MRTLLPLAALLACASVTATAASDYPAPVVKRVPPAERWITPPLSDVPPPRAPERFAADPPQAVEEEPPEPAPPLPRPPRPAAPAPAPAAPPAPPVVVVAPTIAPTITVAPNVTVSPNIVVNPTIVAPTVPTLPTVAPAVAPTCAPAVVTGLVEHPWREGLAVRTGPDLGFTLLAHLFNGQPIWVCNRQGNWLEIVEPVSGLQGWSSQKWIALTGGAW